MNEDTLTVGQLAEAIGEKPRAVQFWTEAGVLRPVAGTARGGKGTHRRYPRQEVSLARLASRLAKMNSPIGEIIDVVEKIREYKEISPHEAFSLIARHFESAASELRRREEKDAKATFQLGHFLCHIAEWWLLAPDYPRDVYILVVFGESDEEGRDVSLWSDDDGWISLWGTLTEFAGALYPNHAGLKLIRADALELREIVLGERGYDGPTDRGAPARMAASVLKMFFDVVEEMGIDIITTDSVWGRLRTNADRLAPK